MHIAALVLSKHYSIQGTDTSIWERIRPFRNGSRHAGTDPLLNVRILSKMSESVTKCPAPYIMFQWCGGQGWKFITEGLLVQYTLWGEAMLVFFFSPTGVPVAGGGAGSNLPVGKYWPFLPVSHSSIFLRNGLRNSSCVTLRYTSRFICVVRNLFLKRRHTFRTV
jgi:hypothetical protein